MYWSVGTSIVHGYVHEHGSVYMYSLVQIWGERSAFFKANAFQGRKDQTAQILIQKYYLVLHVFVLLALLYITHLAMHCKNYTESLWDKGLKKITVTQERNVIKLKPTNSSAFKPEL